MSGHETTLRQLRAHAIGLITLHPDNTRTIKTHDLLDKAPIPLLGLAAENRSGGIELIAEIGFFRKHPYTAHHTVVHLNRQKNPTPVSDDFVRSVAPAVIEVAKKVVASRVMRWQNNSFSRWLPFELASARQKKLWRSKIRLCDIPRAIGLSVDHRDQTILRLFEELEWLNPLLQTRITRLPHYLNRLLGGYSHRLQKKYPRGLNECLNLLSRSDGEILLRPHILAAILRKVRKPQLLLDALAESHLINTETHSEIEWLLINRNHPALEFRILPKQAGHWDVQHKGDGLWVILRKRHQSYDTFRIAQPEPAPAPMQLPRV